MKISRSWAVFHYFVKQTLGWTYVSINDLLLSIILFRFVMIKENWADWQAKDLELIPIDYTVGGAVYFKGIGAPAFLDSFKITSTLEFLIVTKHGSKQINNLYTQRLWSLQAWGGKKRAWQCNASFHLTWSWPKSEK